MTTPKFVLPKAFSALIETITFVFSNLLLMWQLVDIYIPGAGQTWD